jgi:hypothetical protein
LRVAILSLIEPAEVARPPEGAASAPARGLLRLGGHALARHQLGLALALGAERVICLIGPAAAADRTCWRCNTPRKGRAPSFTAWARCMARWRWWPSMMR